MKRETVFKIREFNRFYMPEFDLLGNKYLGSEYSATEARVLYEIYENDGCNAAYIAKKMNIDKSYLSRTIKSHEKNGYIKRSVSENDARMNILHLTEKGKERTEDFIAKSNAQIGDKISPLQEKECNELVQAIDTIMSILERCKEK